MTATARAALRHRRAILTSIVNVFARAVTILTSLATIPMTVTYLGSERFGLWMTISSFVGLLAFADLGVGNGLINAISSASGRDDRSDVRCSISNAAALLAGLAAVLLMLQMLAGLLVDWSHLFGLKDAVAVAEVRPALGSFAVCLAIGLPLSVVQRTQLGLQLGFINGLWQAAGSLLGLAGVFLAIRAQAGLPWLVSALLGGPLIATAVNAAVFFGRTAPDLLPRARDVTRRRLGLLLRLGVLFLVLQLAAALAYASDNLIAAHLLGAQAVGDYAIAAKLFSVSSIIVSMLLQPLWPAYGEAMAQGDIAWARSTLRRATILAAAVAASIAVVISASFQWVTLLWVHRPVDAPAILLLGFALWAVVDAVGQSLAMFLNGAHVVRVQVVLASVFSITCISLKILLVGHFGVAAFPWAVLLVYIPISFVPVLWMMKKWLPKPAAA